MSNTSFDCIVQELQKQQQVMRNLQAENRALHQQLTDLRNGHGICLVINGEHSALRVSFAEEHFSMASPHSQSATVEEVTTTIAKVYLPEKTKSASFSQTPSKPVANASTTFLEEVMLSEFASAMDSSLPPLPEKFQDTQKAKKAGDEQMAALRRDLIGSYLLD